MVGQREALVVEAVDGGVAARVGDRGLGQCGADSGVGKGKDPAAGLGLANHAPLGVVLVGEIGGEWLHSPTPRFCHLIISR